MILLCYLELLLAPIILLIIIQFSNGLTPTDCSSRLWPSFEIFLPVAFMDGNRRFEYRSHFLRSLMLFWPFDDIDALKNVSMAVLYDGEKRFTHMDDLAELTLAVGAIDARIPGGFRLIGVEPSDYYHGRGHDRQQLLMFWADNFTQSEFVGFCDTDTIFIQYVDRGDIFVEDKPLIHGSIGVAEPMKHGVVNDYFIDVFNSTADAMGGLETPMRCMTYFPVVIKTAHLKDMRDYITRIKNCSHFDEAFLQFTHRSWKFEQFTIMCSYLWYFKNSEYSWNLREGTSGWNGIDPRPFEGQSGNVSMFSKSMYSAPPRIATHGRHRTWKFYTGKARLHDVMDNADELDRVFLRGVCLSPPFPKANSDFESICQRVNNSIGEFYDEAHQFEYIVDRVVMSESALKEADKLRHDRIKNCQGLQLQISEASTLLRTDPMIQPPHSVKSTRSPTSHQKAHLNLHAGVNCRSGPKGVRVGC